MLTSLYANQKKRDNDIMFWQDECDYIRGIAETSDFYDYNNDRACFERYCIMQARRAHKLGFKDSAAHIMESVVITPL